MLSRGLAYYMGAVHHPSKARNKDTPPGTDEEGYIDVDKYVKYVNRRARAIWEYQHDSASYEPIGIAQVIILLTLQLHQFEYHAGFYAPTRLDMLVMYLPKTAETVESGLYDDTLELLSRT